MSRRIKYLGINLPKEMTGLFTKSYEKTDERIKADTRNGKDIL
jgi:hypothetical protein